MAVRGLFIIIVCLSFASGLARADEAIYRYEGDVLPYPDAGWLWGGCESPCTESVADGHFVLRWVEGRDQVNYTYRIPDPPPATLWVEWRFLSNHPFGGTNQTCDGWFVVRYVEIVELLFIYGDAVISYSGDEVRSGLGLNEFRTYRFESLNGAEYCFWVDGEVFSCGTGFSSGASDALQMIGSGGCNRKYFPAVNKWDFVRYGAISYGETIISSDPPSGFVDARQYAPLDRFTVTFDSANYVFVDEVAVTVTSGVAPAVIQTRRLDNGDPETVEIVLDQPIPYGATTTFTFDDGVAVNLVEFTFAHGDTDGDGDADLRDVAALQACFGRETLTGACLALDSITDDTIDLDDYAEFEATLRGP